MTFKVVILAVISVTLGAAKLSHIPHLEGRIVGGQPVDIKDYPYQVQLLRDNQHICGGSIISTRFIVTAAHCTENTPPKSFSIRVGTSQRNQGGQVHQIRDMHQHPDFVSETYDYDITLFELETPLQFGEGIAAVGLPAEGQQVAVGTSVVTSGWGMLTENGVMPRQLQAVTVRTISNVNCNELYDGAVTGRMMCAGVPEGGKDACQGDSGGPLVAGGKLVGIVSWGEGCARKEFPGIYSDVSVLRDYIARIAGI